MKNILNPTLLPQFGNFLLCRFAALAVLVTFFAFASENEVFGADVEDPLILQAGDILRITFPAAPELDVELNVRRDGITAMPIIGEIVAAGKTPSQLEAELEKLYEGELVSSEVMVSVLESQFTYYLEGEVRNPGIITSFRQLSVLEAIIAAGGVDKVTGKLTSVIVLRRKGGKYKRFDLNIKAVLDGKDENAFVLESYDVVSIPQRVW